jgi:RNA polymerase sigma factor (sigma-70 family)
MFSRPAVVKYLQHGECRRNSERDSENDVVPDDQNPSSFETAEETDRTTSSPGTVEIDGSTLARRFSRGEPETVALVSSLVGRVIRRRGYYIPYDERPDVIQETIMDLVRAVKGRSFGNDDLFEGFVRMVTHRRCIDWTRLARKRARIEPAFLQRVLPDDTLLAKERRNVAVNVFSKLKKPCRELLALRVGRGLTYAQMAQLLQRSEGALRTQSYHCLKQARIILSRMRRRSKLVSLADWRNS